MSGTSELHIQVRCSPHPWMNHDSHVNTGLFQPGLTHPWMKSQVYSRIHVEDKIHDKHITRRKYETGLRKHRKNGRRNLRNNEQKHGARNKKHVIFFPVLPVSYFLLVTCLKQFPFCIRYTVLLLRSRACMLFCLYNIHVFLFRVLSRVLLYVRCSFPSLLATRSSALSFASGCICTFNRQFAGRFPVGRRRSLFDRDTSPPARLVRIMRVIFSKMEIQNAKKYPKIFSKNAKYHPKCRKNSFHCHGNQYGRHILDWEVGIFMTPRIS